MKIKRNFSEKTYRATQDLSFYYDQGDGIRLEEGEHYHIKRIIKCGTNDCGFYMPTVMCSGKVVLAEDDNEIEMCLWDNHRRKIILEEVKR